MYFQMAFQKNKQAIRIDWTAAAATVEIFAQLSRRNVGWDLIAARVLPPIRWFY